MDKKQLSERDICTKYITPAIKEAGWDINTQVLEEFYFTKDLYKKQEQRTTKRNVAKND